VLSVVQLLTNKRGDAAIITDERGGLAGIITDTDITRRVVAKHLSPSSTCVSDAMTSNPTCVAMSDPATEALVTMVENRFRHLPVTDDNGAVVGVLDIAKCLNDAITKLERSKENSNSAAEDAVKQMASLQGAGGAQAAALQQFSFTSAHKSVKSFKSGKNSVKLADPVSKLRPKAPMISHSDDTVLAVVQLLANKRGDAAIITDNNGGMAGIITDTDVTRRVVAKNLSPSTTSISDVMTANPTCVSMSDPATEALVTMVENRFRHLPVTDDNGAVVGVL
ncbi:hypothetical protein THAPSDRAFT_262854, partial [Thalassiosira pseudonana CCMP1335]